MAEAVTQQGLDFKHQAKAKVKNFSLKTMVTCKIKHFAKHNTD